MDIDLQKISNFLDNKHLVSLLIQKLENLFVLCLGNLENGILGRLYDKYLSFKKDNEKKDKLFTEYKIVKFLNKEFNIDIDKIFIDYEEEKFKLAKHYLGKRFIFIVNLENFIWFLKERLDKIEKNDVRREYHFKSYLKNLLISKEDIIQGQLDEIEEEIKPLDDKLLNNMFLFIEDIKNFLNAINSN